MKIFYKLRKGNQVKHDKIYTFIGCKKYDYLLGIWEKDGEYYKGGNLFYEFNPENGYFEPKNLKGTIGEQFREFEKLPCNPF